MTGKWKTLPGKPVEDIHEFIREATQKGQDVHIGTDSLQAGRYTQFVTVIVIHTKMKGGRVVYQREIVPRIQSLRERLSKEVWKSVELAMQIPEVVGLTIHIDANPDERFMSQKYLQELVGMVVGQGFKALYKPDSWAASHAADHCVRYKNGTRSQTQRRHEIKKGNRRVA
jgi:predicted RNase H-related nuclease YkuK (DUF458 family)